jgi:diphthamide biosynthesis enzyme Dph1/Dph2-like protein
METLFIEVRRKFKDSEVNYPVLNEILGEKISLCATIQYIELIPKVKKYLESKGKKVLIKKGVCYEGHVLGCNSLAFDKTADVLLLISDGKFHSINNAIQLQREIYVFNTKTLERVSQKEIKEHNKKTLAKKKIFLSADIVGVILSSKIGQRNNSIENLKKRIEKMNKKVFVFECDNVDSGEFENFPQVKIWVNTSCLGLARDDKKIINLSDILEFLD